MKKIRITFNAPMTLGFVLLCFSATLLGVLSSGKITEVFFMTYHSSLANFMTYVRFFTHVLGHEGWEHFIKCLLGRLIIPRAMRVDKRALALRDIV